jgi:hypothetical protein
MELQDVPATRLLMKTIHILRDQSEPRDAPLQLGNRLMPAIRPSVGNQPPPPVVPLPNKPRITSKRLRSSKMLSPEIPPKTTRPTECRNATLR